MIAQINFDEFKCRCSAGSIMLSDSNANPQITEKQLEKLKEYEKKVNLTENQQVEFARLQQLRKNGDKVILSDTLIAYLMEYYSWVTAGKKSVDKETMYIQFVEKGKDVEEDSILLLNAVDGEEYHKNEERVSNDFLTGIPDIFVGNELMAATKISDIKSAWDYPGFLKKIHKPVSRSNDIQIKCYMDITGAPVGEVADCLVNTPMRIQKDYYESLLRRMNVISQESPDFIQEWAIIERSMNFDDIPPRKRVFKKLVTPFEQFERKKLYDRVKICREWLWKFDEMYRNLNK